MAFGNDARESRLKDKRLLRLAGIATLGTLGVLALTTAATADAPPRAPTAQGAGASRGTTEQPKKPAGVLLDVPYVKQKGRNGCGAASLSMVMRYWAGQQRRKPSPRARQRAIEQALDPRGHGIANTALESYLRDSGYRTFAFSGRWSDLRENLENGRPLIVGLGPKGKKGPLHYVVVAGIDWEHDFVFLNDPAERKLFRVDRGRFEREWQVTGNWTLLAVPQPVG